MEENKTIHLQDICDRLGIKKKDAARIARDAGAVESGGRWPVYDMAMIGEYIAKSGAGAEHIQQSTLRATREKLGLTQKQVSDITKIPKRTIEGWDEGHAVPPEWMLALVVEKLEAAAPQEESEGRIQNMKKIINGKMYNTDTAKLVGEYEASCSRSDFNYYEEGLYRKKTGEFFLAGAGNANSKYATQIDCNTRCGGGDIRPMTEEEARKYAEKHLTVDEYVAIFGEPEE